MVTTLLHDRAFIAAIGRHCRLMRESLGLSQVEIADAAGTSQGAISRLESGKHVDLRFIGVVNVIRALAAAVPYVQTAVSPTVQVLLAIADNLPPLAAPPLDPELATFLRAYYALPATTRKTCMRLLLPIVAYLADAGRDNAAA